MSWKCLSNIAHSMAVLMKGKMQSESLKFTWPVYSRLILGNKQLQALFYVLEERLLTNVCLEYSGGMFDFKGTWIGTGPGFSYRNLFISHKYKVKNFHWKKSCSFCLSFVQKCMIALNSNIIFCCILPNCLALSSWYYQRVY